MLQHLSCLLHFVISSLLAGEHDLSKFFVSVIPAATEILMPVVAKYGLPPTQEGV